MKVINKVALTLALAAPLTLVSADELVINVSTNVLNKGGKHYSQDIKEVLNSTPMTFGEIVIVPPTLDSAIVIENKSTVKANALERETIGTSPEVAYTD